ncbi:IS3 family transposase [Pediococcus pentosaceus]|uniref:IS3 family transposase n=1 Tax=Pediococcus pentosaceus TaxID=1255 RepID=UPI003857409E
MIHLLSSHSFLLHFTINQVLWGTLQQNQTECLNGFPQCKVIGEFKEITKNYVDWFNSRRISQKTKA